MKVNLCPGIGDSLWVLQKLLSTKKKYDIFISDEMPQRGLQAFELLPQLTSSLQYGRFGSDAVLKNNIQNKKWRYSQFENFDEVYLSANKHLESGMRIETFLADLNMVYYPDYDTARYAPKAEQIIGGNIYIGIYTSAYSPVRAWGFWDAVPWVNLMKSILAVNRNVKFILLGAKFDIDLMYNVQNAMRGQGIPLYDMIGEPLGLVMEVMKRLKYFFSFPSGLGILAASIKTPTMMFYPQHLNAMRGTWGHPEMIENNTLHEPLFCSEVDAFNWVKNEYKLFDKI